MAIGNKGFALGNSPMHRITALETIDSWAEWAARGERFQSWSRASILSAYRFIDCSLTNHPIHCNFGEGEGWLTSIALAKYQVGEGCLFQLSEGLRAACLRITADQVGSKNWHNSHGNKARKLPNWKMEDIMINEGYHDKIQIGIGPQSYLGD